MAPGPWREPRTRATDRHRGRSRGVRRGHAGRCRGNGQQAGRRPGRRPPPRHHATRPGLRRPGQRRLPRPLAVEDFLQRERRQRRRGSSSTRASPAPSSLTIPGNDQVNNVTIRSNSAPLRRSSCAGSQIHVLGGPQCGGGTATVPVPPTCSGQWQPRLVGLASRNDGLAVNGGSPAQGLRDGRRSARPRLSCTKAAHEHALSRRRSRPGRARRGASERRALQVNILRPRHSSGTADPSFGPRVQATDLPDQRPALNDLFHGGHSENDILPYRACATPASSSGARSSSRCSIQTLATAAGPRRRERREGGGSTGRDILVGRRGPDVLLGRGGEYDMLDRTRRPRSLHRRSREDPRTPPAASCVACCPLHVNAENGEQVPADLARARAGRVSCRRAHFDGCRRGRAAILGLLGGHGASLLSLRRQPCRRGGPRLG